jgi:hypothetical protein
MYEPYEIDISYKYLKTVVGRLEEPICLIGGWAVFQNVNKNFKKATGRDYIGSRDIDLGFHFETDWSEKDMHESTFAKSLQIIEEDLGFMPVGFRYLKEFHIETEQELSNDEAKTTPQHFVFPLYIDPVVDTIHPKLLPKPHVLLATKLNSVIGRDKEHKRLKDIADIFALLWFSDVEILDIKSNLLVFYDRGNINKTQKKPEISFQCSSTSGSVKASM